MLQLFLLAAAQVQTVKLPPVSVPQPSPPVTAPVEVPPVAEVTARLLPDLVVKSVTVEGDSAVQVEIANQGTGPAVGEFGVGAMPVVDGAEGRGGGVSVRDLAAGETRSVSIPRSSFSFPGEVYYEGMKTKYLLSRASKVQAYVDPPVVTGTMFGPLVPKEVSAGTPCTLRGCIRELDENNNSLSIEGDAIARGSPGVPERG